MSFCGIEPTHDVTPVAAAALQSLAYGSIGDGGDTQLRFAGPLALLWSHVGTLGQDLTVLRTVIEYWNDAGLTYLFAP